MDNLTFDITNLIVSIVCVVVARYVIPYVRQKLSNSAIKEFEWWVDWAVNWAEQICQEKGDGENKKTLVKNFLSEILKDKPNISITDDQLEILIESSVRYMNNTDIAFQAIENEDE